MELDRKPVTKSDFIYTPDKGAGEFVMVILRENELTIDGRMIELGATEWRNPPIPLMMNRINGVEGQHKNSLAAASIVDIWRDGATIYGRGVFSSDEEGQEARQLIKEGVISRVSADMAGTVSEGFDVDRPDQVRKLVKKGIIVAVTALPMSSFNDTQIAVTAAAAPQGWAPPSDWFKSPQFEGPTPLTVTADGRIFGHAAIWGTCHVGYKDKCVQPPRSNSGYQYFNTGTVLCADGKKASVGRLTAGTGHAAMEFGAQPAVSHYDDNGWAAGYIHASEDEWGITYAGAVAPTANTDQIVALRAGAVSGDWRTIGFGLEFVGLLAVNMPGFPIPRTQSGFVASAQTSLVAAGVVTAEEFGCAPCVEKIMESLSGEVDVAEEVVEIELSEETVVVPEEVVEVELADEEAEAQEEPLAEELETEVEEVEVQEESLEAEDADAELIIQEALSAIDIEMIGFEMSTITAAAQSDSDSKLGSAKTLTASEISRMKTAHSSTKAERFLKERLGK
jgi:hypothetical protein